MTRRTKEYLIAQVNDEIYRLNNNTIFSFSFFDSFKTRSAKLVLLRTLRNFLTSQPQEDRLEQLCFNDILTAYISLLTARYNNSPAKEASRFYARLLMDIYESLNFLGLDPYHTRITNIRGGVLDTGAVVSISDTGGTDYLPAVIGSTGAS